MTLCVAETAARSAGAGCHHHTYDAVANRLTEVTPGGAVSYAYDIARAASRSDAEGQPADERGRGELHVV
jgi:hypothetical protein